jgi:hypothetical protein
VTVEQKKKSEEKEKEEVVETGIYQLPITASSNLVEQYNWLLDSLSSILIHACRGND